ncbi:hypothetical protein WJX72_007852 [[Myrmecia] bisecta]|uniref:Uncharacterized protein n=1 Tax=[Myrmecia] bisecta TaxID=41462 RepID=A0AAW1PXN2_9CHLO
MDSSAVPSTSMPDATAQQSDRRSLTGFLYKRRRIIGEDDVAGPSPAAPTPSQPTLAQFLAKRRANSQQAAPQAEQPPASQPVGETYRRQRDLETTVLRQVLDLQQRGRCQPALRAALHHSSWSGHDQVTSQPLCMPHQPALQANMPLPRPHNIHQRFANAMNVANDYVSDIKMDAQGELFVSVSSGGAIAVHDFAQLRALRGCQPPVQSREDYEGLDPVVLIDAKRRLEAVQWSPSDQNIIATVSSSDRSIEIYDLQYCQGPPTYCLSLPPRFEPSGAGCMDLAFFHGGQYNMLAAGSAAAVFLWDRRTSSAPRAVLRDGGSSCGLTCVQLSADDTILHVGTQSGKVLTWDMRGGTTSEVMFGGSGFYRHPLLQSTDLHSALLGVPGLAQQTKVPVSSVHALAGDPLDGRRLAFHLACGWSGVLDLTTQRITHVHCPPPMWQLAPTELDGALEALLDRQEALVAHMMTGWRVQRRRPAWAACGRTFCVGSAAGDAVVMLDFSAGSASPCAVPEQATGPDEERQHASARFKLPTSVKVPVVSPVMALAAHPQTDELVGGSRDNTLLLLTSAKEGWRPE